MRMIALAGLALALSACGGGGDKSGDDANILNADDMMMNDAMLPDSNQSLNSAAGIDANGSVDAGTANMMAKDAVTNDADTNLANGL
ncbi:MAG TPA: hypothetical protein VFQ67_16820 [Allosphingosinicella sp.]|jgi:hypothetical protein|nr:hypothetical protein [Allosphingosinicella sp.]